VQGPLNIRTIIIVNVTHTYTCCIYNLQWPFNCLPIPQNSLNRLNISTLYFTRHTLKMSKRDYVHFKSYIIQINRYFQLPNKKKNMIKLNTN